MAVLDEIKASAEAARNAIDAARSQVKAAISEASDKAQQVASLGLEGVAVTVQAAQRSLEAAASGLCGAHDAADGAVNALAAINAKTGAKDSAQRLGPVVAQLGQASSGVATAHGSVQEAYTYSQQAEIDSLTGVAYSTDSAARSRPSRTPPARPTRTGSRWRPSREIGRGVGDGIAVTAALLRCRSAMDQQCRSQAA